MKTKRRLAMMLALLLVSMSAAIPASATSHFSPEDILKKLDGIETAYARKYVADRDLGFATPVLSDASTPDVMLITVLEFETDAQAAAAFDSLMSKFVAGMIIGETDIELTESVIDGLGDYAILYTGVDENLDTPEHEALLEVQVGNLGFLITAHGGDASTPERLNLVAEFMISAEPGTGGFNVDEIGASGGTFDIMPGRDETDILHGRISMHEYDLLLIGDDEPLYKQPHATPAARNGTRITLVA